MTEIPRCERCNRTERYRRRFKGRDLCHRCYRRANRSGGKLLAAWFFLGVSP